MTVRTRFAPSPTGYLHIGGVRTALFCWLFARSKGGQFILRIDDTDQQRNVEAALEPILHGLQWLGIDWDEGPEVGGDRGPYYQSQRSDLYAQAVEQLLASGHAYWDYATTDEIAAERDAARESGGSFTYSRKWMAETDADRARFEAEGRQGVVRLKMPREGSLVLDDMVRGRVEFAWAREQDAVIQRADGSCLYHLASTVDDHLMGMTHVIRAEEHLPNTPRQAFIAQSLGYPLPTYAHLPYVAAPGGKQKLSKRKLATYLKNRDFAKLVQEGELIAQRLGLNTEPDTFNPVIVDFYEQTGYLPEAIVNYLALLGWSLDDRTEHFTRDELIEHFSLERVGSSPAAFDPQKLSAFQAYHMQQISTQERTEQCIPFLIRSGMIEATDGAISDDLRTKITSVVAAADDRIKVAGDILAFDEFFTADDELEYEEKAMTKRIVKPEDAVGLLVDFRAVLAAVEPFDVEHLETALKSFVAECEIKIGQIIHALRVAVTGKGVGLGMFDAMAIIGRDSCLKRIDRALAAAEEMK